MPTARDAMYSALAEDSGVKAVVGEAIYPDQAEQDLEPPYLLVQVNSDGKLKGMKSVVPYRRCRFTLTGYCNTRDEAQALQSTLEALFDGKHDMVYGGLNVDVSKIAEDPSAASDDDDPPDLGESSGPRIVRLEVSWGIKG